MPNLIINKFKGLNSTVASLQLQPGEFQFTQNFRGRPYDNFAKRQGIEPVSVQTSPVMGIFEYSLDGVTIPMIDSGGSLTFQADTSSPSFPTLPDIYPSVTPPIDPTGDRTVLFNVEQTMRAIQDRRAKNNESLTTWPNLIFASNGTLLNGNTGIAVSSYPANNLYAPDLTYHDMYYGNPVGTRAAALVNAIIASCVNSIGSNRWVNMTTGIEGQSSIPIYTTSIFPTASSATRANYDSKLVSCKTGIRKLTTIKKQATQTSVEDKSGTAQDSGICDSGADNTIYSISGYSDTLFSPASSCCDSGFGGDDVQWGGQFKVISPLIIHLNPTPSRSGVLYIASLNTQITGSINCGDGLPGRSWTIAIGCANNDCDPDTDDRIIWIGTKTTPDGTPPGTYTKTGGTASLASLTLV